MTNVGRQKSDKERAKLRSGDRMNSAEFHRLYENMPPDFRAELIGGVVHEPSPVRMSHGESHVLLTLLLGTYANETPGVELFDNATVILGAKDEVQPDLVLRIAPAFGGRSRNTPDGYIEGAPELLVEIAVTSRSMDLNTKRKRYQIAGVQEYIVVCPETKELHWFDLSNDLARSADKSDITKSKVFPGLWLSRSAVVECPDFNIAVEMLRQGMAIERAAFVEQLNRNGHKDC